MKKTRISASEEMKRYRAELLEARKKGLIPNISLPNWMKQNARTE